MYSFLHELLSDRKGGEIFTLFSLWHFFYIAITIVTVAVVLLLLKNKTSHRRESVTRIVIFAAFGLYMADFFLMPLAYGEIDIEKLPFHACTAMCVMCFLSYHSRCLEKYRMSFVLLGFLSNFVYLIYPAGVMWHSVHPLSYRVIQTLLFHSIMTVYGLLMLIYNCDKLDIQKCCRDLAVVAGMTLWAMLGNYAYNGTSGEYSHFFNWFFVVRDPFYLFPESIAPYIMPVINIALFFGAEILVHLLILGIRRICGKRR